MSWMKQNEEKEASAIQVRNKKRMTNQLFYRFILVGLLITLPYVSTNAKKTEKEKAAVVQESVLSSKDQFKFNHFYLEALRNKEAGDLASASDNLYRCHLINPNSAIIFFELATISSMQQMYNSATTYAQRAVAMNPSSVRYKRALAELTARVDNYEKAIEMYNEMIVIDPDHKKEYYPQLAALYSTTKQYDKACEALDKYAELTELSPAIVEEKFKLYLQANNKKKAFEQVDKLIEQYPDVYGYISYKAELYLALQDSVSAQKTFQQALKKNPDDPSLYYIYAQYLEKHKQLDQAYNYYLKAIHSPITTYDVTSASILAIAADSTMAVSTPDTLFDHFIQTYPDEYLPYFSKGLQNYMKKDSSCYDLFKKSLIYNPLQQDTWDMLIEYYGNISQTDSLYSTCQEALKVYPSNEKYHYSYGNACKSLNKDSMAIAEWKTAVQLCIDKNNFVLASAIMGIIGDSYHERGEREKGFAAYDTALVYDESNVLVMNNYAYFLSCENKDLQKAERLSGKSVKANPNSPEFLDTYAWICFKLGEYSMAHLYIEQAYNRGGDKSGELMEHYGDILYKIGESKDTYLPLWKKALELHEQQKDNYSGIDKLKKKIETENYVE